MYIPRNIDRELTNWKIAQRRKPLLLRGVRQCGKTEAVRHLGQSFSGYVEINLEKQRRLHALFEKDINIPAILAGLEVESGKEIVPGETLLFLDEIQECPRAITALRYFYEEKPELHVIAAGSLLEFALNNRKRPVMQFPVGRVRSLYMYPLAFSEFLTATGNTLLRKRLEDPTLSVLDSITHEKLLDHYKKFLIVGGMPEAVSTFTEKNSFLECQRIHRDIVTNFLEDFDKYSREVPAENLRIVFEYAMHHACNQVRDSNAVPGMSAYQFRAAYELLRRAGLVIPVLASACDVLPLGAGEKESNRKLLPFDTGILLTECNLDAAGILTSDVFEALNKGNLAELATGLELMKASEPYREAKLYYWYRSGANAEVDYVYQKGESVIPIEVKASVKGGMKSLRSFLQWKGSPYGIRCSMENFTEYGDVHVIPLYAVSTL